MAQAQPAESTTEDRKPGSLPEREPGMPRTRAEYAAYTRVSTKTIDRQIKDGMPHMRVGKIIRIVPALADAWLATRRPKPREKRAA